MTRDFPARRFLQTPNGLHQHFHSPRVLEENLIDVGNNVSATPFLPVPVTCQPLHQIHSSGIFFDENPLTHTFSLLLFELILLTVITRLVRFLLKPLRQPTIVSQIIGGIILGPSVLRQNRWFESNIMPEKAQFLVNNLGIMGFMFFVFVYGVKMDPSLLKKSGKMHVYTALIGIIIPTISVFIAALFMRKNMDKELTTISSLGGVAGYLGITAFPVLYNVLKELNLLSSDVGKMALSTALIGDALGVGTIVVFEAGKQGETGTKHALWYIISLVLLVAFLLFCIRPAMVWISENTPQGQPVDQSYIVAILLGVFVMGFLTDMFGIAIANGSLWLGLAIPDGPPLGAALVQKSETIMTEFLLPFSFLLVGSYTDVFAMSAVDWSHLSPLFVMVLTGYLTKFFSTWIATIYWKMPYRDGLALSLIMSLRGQVELILFVHLMDKKIIKVPGFTLLVLMTITLTATFTPLISIFYDPTRPYMVNQRRNIQHTAPDTELRIVLSIIDTESVTGLIHLLRVSNSTSNSPLSIYALRLIELVGRANPLFIDHEQQEVPPIYQWTQTINALKLYQEDGEEVKLQFFTAVGPKRSMFQDICELALEHEAALIILPFNKGGVHIHGVRTVNSLVLNHAPCSVGVLVDKGLLEMTTTSIGNSFRHDRYKFAVLFLGGADAREALVYADRMVANKEVSLTVVRFLSQDYEGDNEMEKKLDDGIVTWFWVKNETNERVVYREVVVSGGEETIAAIQAMNDGAYDLWIVGRKHGINPVLLTGLSEWSENEELGLIGDYVSSVDFPGSASVLVVQQQILRG